MILKKSLKILVPLLCLFLVAEIFYLSWLPEGHLGPETYLPVWLLDWSNRHFNLRTAIPFTVLSFLIETEYYLMLPFYKRTIISPFRIWNLGLSILLVCLAELGQFFLSHRHPDFKDVMFGVLGSVLGSWLFYGFVFFKQKTLTISKKEVPTL